MKLRGHETFFIRKGWLSKGLKHIANTPEVFVSKTDNPMDVLGIGNNMVKSLRYWMQAAGLATEPKSGVRKQSMTDFGTLVYKYDRYIEEVGTLLLLHYKLACNERLATAWYFFFQEFGMREFGRDDFVRALNNYIVLKDTGAAPAERSMQDDFNCLINTYVSRHRLSQGKAAPENNIDCPLGELGLIDIVSREKKLYRKQTPSLRLFNAWILLAMILEQQKLAADTNGDAMEIELQYLLTGKNGIGRIFNLDTLAMVELLRLAEAKGLLKIVRTAGLDVIRLSGQYTVKECLVNYYESLIIAEERVL